MVFKNVIIMIYNYIITNIVNGKCYIGMHSTNTDNDRYLGSGVSLKLAIKKYGRGKFIKNILCICETKEEAYKNESFFIEKYNTLYPSGYNISPKGGHHVKGGVSDVTKKKISNSKLGDKNPMFGRDQSGVNNPNFGTIRSLESNKKTSLSLLGMFKGEKNGMFGKKGIENPRYGTYHTDEAKEKNRIAHLGIPQSLETILKRIASNTGQKRSEESKQRMCKPKSIEACKNMSKARQKYWDLKKQL